MAGTRKARPKNEARAAQPPKVRRKTVSPYATKEWRAARKKHLAEHPDCQIEECGQKRGQRHVHHVVGIALDPEHKNLRTACPTHHDAVELIVRRRGNYAWRQHLDVWRWAQEKLKAQQEAK